MVRQAAYEFVEHTWGQGLLFLFPQNELYQASPIQRPITYAVDICRDIAK